MFVTVSFIDATFTAVRRENGFDFAQLRNDVVEALEFVLEISVKVFDKLSRRLRSRRRRIEDAFKAAARFDVHRFFVVTLIDRTDPIVFVALNRVLRKLTIG